MLYAKELVGYIPYYVALERMRPQAKLLNFQIFEGRIFKSQWCMHPQVNCPTILGKGIFDGHQIHWQFSISFSVSFQSALSFRLRE